MKDKQNNFAVIALAVVAVIAVIASLVMGLSKSKVEEFAGFAAPGFNQFFSTTLTATTTQSSGLPVKLLAKNSSRLYAIIVNDSDTDIYIHLNSFDDAQVASTTVNVNTGIRLNSNGGSYELLPENIYAGEVWATSTVPNKTILITEK